VIKENNADPSVGVIDEVSRAHPEVMLAAARKIKGTSYMTLVTTTLGRTTGSFRNANEGTVPVKSIRENRKVECFILEPIIECDKAVADKSEDGAEASIARETSDAMEGEMQGIGACFYYGRGTNGNSKAYPGLIDAYDSVNMVVDAGGTTDDTASSAWFVKFGPKDVQWILGGDGSFAFRPPVTVISVDPNDSTKRLTVYQTGLTAWMGLQVGSLRSIVRIKKITADSTKTLTDAMMAAALAKFPVGTRPDVIFMSRRSLAQLQASRTAINATGAPAPTPTEYMGIPIQPTDSIVNTEKLAS
jgi:hypothetical protein